MGDVSTSSEASIISEVDHWSFSCEMFLEFLGEPSWIAALLVLVVIALNSIWLIVWQALAGRKVV